jgi:methylated-DNA-[protein]-cysteine S-methyltransferase
MESTMLEKSRAHSQRLAYTFMDSPVGRLMLAGDEKALWLLSFANGHNPVQPGDLWQLSESPFQETKRQLMAYFNGELRDFTIPVRLVGTEFQRAVWNTLPSIPYGSTWSYGELARSIGKPEAVRAVGGANHANPIAIIIPCHRVIGSNGKLVGYGGGLDIKDRLLAFERGELITW